MKIAILLLVASIASAKTEPRAVGAAPPGIPTTRPLDAVWKKGADKSFPRSYMGALYRQAGINAELARREFPYRVFRSERDGSFVAVHKVGPREYDSIEWAHGDRARGPALAFGSQPRSPEDRQELHLEYALWALELPEAEVYTDAFDPYKAIGRLDLQTGALVFERRDRVNDLLLWLGRKRPDVETWAVAVEKALADALHDDGGQFKRIEADLKDGKWSFGLRTTKTRMDSGAPVFFAD